MGLKLTKIRKWLQNLSPVREGNAAAIFIYVNNHKPLSCSGKPSSWHISALSNNELFTVWSDIHSGAHCSVWESDVAKCFPARPQAQLQLWVPISSTCQQVRDVEVQGCSSPHPTHCIKHSHPLLAAIHSGAHTQPEGCRWNKWLTDTVYFWKL